MKIQKKPSLLGFCPPAIAVAAADVFVIACSTLIVKKLSVKQKKKHEKMNLPGVQTQMHLEPLPLMLVLPLLMLMVPLLMLLVLLLLLVVVMLLVPVCLSSHVVV